MMLPRATLWIKVRPKGRGSNSNRSVIGARVLVRYAGKVQAQWVTSQSSFYLQMIRVRTSAWERRRR
jgi:hypothetical protein